MIQTQSGKKRRSEPKDLAPSWVGFASLSTRDQVQMRSAMKRAMEDADHWVVEFDYEDFKGERSHRVVSPIRFAGVDRVLGLCLSREEPRQFYLNRCRNVRLKHSSECLMPMPLMACEAAGAYATP